MKIALTILSLVFAQLAMAAPAAESDNVHTTKIRLQQLATTLAKAKVATGKYPTDTGWITTKDAWGNAFVYSSTGQHYQLKSLGQDGKEGGVGEDMDLVRSE